MAIPWGTLPIDASTDNLGLAVAYRDHNEGSSDKFGITGYREWGDELLADKDLS